MIRSRPERIRIWENHTLNDGRQSLPVRTVFQDLQVGQHKVLRHQRQLWGHWVYIAALRLEDASLLVIATQTVPKLAIADYAKRWGVETLSERASRLTHGRCNSISTQYWLSYGTWCNACFSWNVRGLYGSVLDSLLGATVNSNTPLEHTKRYAE